MKAVGSSLRALLVVAICGGALAVPASAQAPLNQYVVTHASPKALSDAGIDRTDTGSVPGSPGSSVVVATPAQAEQLRGRGATVTPLSGVSQARAPRKAGRVHRLAPTAHGYDVFRPWSLRPGACPTTCSTPLQPLKSWYHGLAVKYPGIIKEKIIGHSVTGQPIPAYKITANARRVTDGARPAVLYDSTQHAREWIATEVERRLFRYFVRHRKNADVKHLLRTTELWFVPVVNPDGYDYTFTSPTSRLWRKNLRDNDGDGQITTADGVDPNRNFPEKWNWDLEGSSDDPADETYHGTGPASEPEVQAMSNFEARLHPAFQLDYHSFARLILYPEGWQVETPATDAPILAALAGNSDDPAVPGFDPEPAAQLYTTNGDITDDAYKRHGILAYTVELDGGSGDPVGGTDGSDPNYVPGGFVFQDREADVQAEFEKNLPFALDLARSASHPDTPTSHSGNRSPNIVPTTFSSSNGVPQTVEANARKSSGAVTAHWTINGGAERTTPTTTWPGGQRYGDPGVYYRRVRAQINGMKPGDRVRVWFTAQRGARSPAFTYRVTSDSGKPVLLMVAEDYTGRSSLQTPTPYSDHPLYSGYYEKALQAAGIKYDVYDVDANGRTAATNLGVLSHYKAVVWETGDDVIVRGPDQVRPGSPESGATTGTSKLFADEIYNVRDFMNEGGKLLAAGQLALEGAWEQQTFNPLGETPPNPFCPSSLSLGNGFDNSPDGQATPCHFVSDDFMQYWLGAWSTLDGGDPAAATLQELPPMGNSPFALNGAGTAKNQQNLYRFLTTSDVLPPDQYPQFTSNVVVKVQGPPAYDPPTGAWYAYSQTGSSNYKRLSTTVDLTGKTSGALSFKLSYSTEPDFDYVFVEAHTPGQDDWTTLPDQNGNTSTDTGAGCPDDDPFWLNTNPFLRHYITRSPDPAGGFACTPTGTSGSWNAATGNSNGFQDWNVDLTPYAGKQVELSITYATDPAVQGLGIFLDDVNIAGNGQTIASTSFEDGTLAPFALGASPADSGHVFRNWQASQSKGFEDGPGVHTSRSVLLGFGLEGVNGSGKRSKILKDGLRLLGVSP
ncbi:MAG: hypothetical protein QOG63_2879 [Thermoleophilaceae bacterium]|nr:hypothetical protein [Thermoleophilaceae bacterium]